MESLLLDLTPFALGLAVTPAAIASCILLLGSKRPIANAVAFCAAFALVYTVISAVVIAVANGADEQLVSEQGKAVLTLVVGAVLLLLGLGSAVHGHGAPPTTRTPGWMTAIDSAGPRVAFGLGTGLAVLNPNIPILIAGLATAASADVSEADRFAGAAFLVVASQAGLAGPVISYSLNRERAKRGLDTAKTWLSRHEHMVNLVVLLVFGALFTVKGVAGL